MAPGVCLWPHSAAAELCQGFQMAVCGLELSGDLPESSDWKPRLVLNVGECGPGAQRAAGLAVTPPQGCLELPFVPLFGEGRNIFHSSIAIDLSVCGQHLMVQQAPALGIQVFKCTLELFCLKR